MVIRTACPEWVTEDWTWTDPTEWEDGFLEGLFYTSSRIVTVYIAGPYTNGHTESNVEDAIAAADPLFDLGYIPFVPHLSHFWDEYYPRSYEQWMQWCCVWLSKCDAVLRLPGESKGADDEVALAAEFGIPVYYSIEELWEATRVR